MKKKDIQMFDPKHFKNNKGGAFSKGGLKKVWGNKLVKF